MTQKEAIFKRKSIRKFDMQPISDNQMNDVMAEIKNLIPLFENIEVSIHVTDKTKGMFNVKAPHYLVFASEEKEGHLENIGFVGQQIDLFLTTIGLGACWLGGAKAVQAEDSLLPYVICMAFGNPAEPLHRNISDFKRKNLTEISTGSDTRLEAARVAPSGVNAQNWLFEAVNGEIHCYRKKPNPLLGILLNKMSYIDVGIAICHIATVSENFKFKKLDDAKEVKNCTYIGSVIN